MGAAVRFFGRVPLTGKRPAAGGLNYPGIGLTEHGRAPEGYPCVVSREYLGEGLALYRRVAQGILTWELQRRSGLRVRTESDVVIPGARVVSGFGFGPFRISAPCEVVWVRRPMPGDGPSQRASATARCPATLNAVRKPSKLRSAPTGGCS
ncbi:conserved hypothetical protein [Arthrobacter sp. Hiyo4]|nr:conserved hypothetical protein [Arthrobacter sp. Hiyo4]